MKKTIPFTGKMKFAFIMTILARIEQEELRRIPEYDTTEIENWYYEFARPHAVLHRILR